jgi:CheY-like chemotaxis protein
MKLETVPCSVRSRRILLVEDNPVNRHICEEMLENLGCLVSTAQNGRVALETLERQSFDLILMDCRMPEMDGIQAVGRIREREATAPPDQWPAHIPIIALIAHALDGDKECCLAAGMDDCLIKPFSLPKLSAAISCWLPQSEADRYLAESPGHLDTMRRALKGEDSQNPRHAAHNLKSNSALLGARTLADLCLNVKSAGLDDVVLDSAELLARIESEYAQVCRILAAIREGCSHAE